jgi:uncharacterized protein YfiM (DUF2279 family)
VVVLQYITSHVPSSTCRAGSEMGQRCSSTSRRSPTASITSALTEAALHTQWDSARSVSSWRHHRAASYVGEGHSTDLT